MLRFASIPSSPQADWSVSGMGGIFGGNLSGSVWFKWFKWFKWLKWLPCEVLRSPQRIKSPPLKPPLNASTLQLIDE